MADDRKYSGMTVNERLFVAGLLDDFEAASRARDVEKMVAILKRVELSESDALAIVEDEFHSPE